MANQWDLTAKIYISEYECSMKRSVVVRIHMQSIVPFIVPIFCSCFANIIRSTCCCSTTIYRSTYWYTHTFCNLHTMNLPPLGTGRTICTRGFDGGGVPRIGSSLHILSSFQASTILLHRNHRKIGKTRRETEAGDGDGGGGIEKRALFVTLLLLLFLLLHLIYSLTNGKKCETVPGRVNCNDYAVG